jgi:hypothetical protein
LGQLKPLLPKEHDPFFKNCSRATHLKNKSNDNLFSFILFMDEKENSGKGSNLKPLSCKGDFNHYISFFPLK